jgi:Xaa-Pro aminopeptidase
MVLCVESLICPVGGKEGVKLETQVLVTENGIERLDRFPWELTPDV